MSEKSSSRLAWILFLLGLIAMLGSFALSRINGRLGDLSELTNAFAFIAIGVTGLILALRRSGNPVGWIYLGIWAVGGIFISLTDEYAAWATLTHPGAPGATLATWLMNWIWVPVFVVLLTFPFLLFPDGHLPSPRWRPVCWAAAIVTVLWSIAFAFENHDYTNGAGKNASNPYAPRALIPLFDVAREVMALVFFVVMGLAIASLVVRFRRSRREERQQIKWLMLSGAILLAWLILPQLQHGNGGWVDAVQGVFLAMIPASVGVAILKYRLYDIDVVIKKTVVFTIVAGVLTVLYLSVLALAAFSTASRILVGLVLLLVTFSPVRRAARLLADRLVYGKRATSYEVLAQFSEHMADTYATDDVLPRMATILAGATDASTATVWLRIGSELRPAARTGDEPVRPAVRIVGGSIPDMPGEDLTAEVRHHGELLGALSVTTPPNDPLDPGREKLVRDLASQAGLVLRNVRLMEELKASRQRLVAAQDEERRKLERNLHDGAQQQLVALQVKIRLAQAQAQKEEATATATSLATLGEDAQGALEDLRDLARGIYPPLLADKGLVAALESQARKAAVPTTIHGDGVGRFGQDVEAAVYFSCLEALQNVAKYAQASRAEISLSYGDATLTFTVTDDGTGFDTAATGYGTGLQGIADRLAALGGSIEVASDPGRGTVCTGRLPARPN